MGRRSRRRREETASAPTTAYVDADGNVLTLRDTLSAGSLRELERAAERPGASLEDRWQRRTELLFERLAVSWTIAGLPLTGQKELLGRFRMADSDTRRWVGETIDRHLRERSLGG